MSAQSPPRAPRSSAHVPELDGVRGIAIAAVMALHFLCSPIVVPANLFERAMVRVTGYGVWGVDLFFVLSGYLITGILADAKGAARYFRTFYMRRTLRIFPLYYAVLLVTVVLLPAGFLAHYAPTALKIRAVQGWLWPYLTNVYLVTQGSFSLPYVSHFWTLAIEEHFYFVWPFIIAFTRRETAMRVCVVLSGLALTSRIVLQTLGYPFTAQILTPCRLDTLAMGAWFALAARGPGGIDAIGRRTLKWLGPLAASVIVLSAIHVARTRLDTVVEPMRSTALAVFFGAAILVSAWTGGPARLRSLLRLRWLRSLGKYSYGLYVYHGIVAYAFLHSSLLPNLQSALGSRTLAVLAAAAIGVTGSMIISVASYELFESKFLKLKRLFQPTHRPAPEPQAVAAALPDAPSSSANRS